MNGFEKAHERIFGYTDAGQSWDGERIVRCRDCMYSWVDGTLCNFWMRDYNFENPTPSNVEPSGFCKWGKPRDEI